MTPRDFILKWREHALTERSSAHQHFLDICRLVGMQPPAEQDPQGAFFTFEKGVPKTGGGDGFADVWYAGRFAWEYKKRKRDLDAAMKQLADYSAALDNPPIHVACDTIKFRIETRFTNTVTKRWEFDLEDLMDDRNLAVLRAVLHDPETLRPSETRESLTREAADKFQAISDRLQSRYADRKEAVAHFVNQLVFCFFADSVRLLPNGGADGRQSLVWKKLLLRATENPTNGNANLRALFKLMAEEPGGELGFETIRWFNGKLFDGRPPLELTRDDFHLLLDAARVKWDLIDPTIFGTLFERFLDPDKRAQIGAHYTDPDKINLILEPVLLRPLRAEWAAARAAIDAALAKPGAAGLRKATAIRDAFLERLRTLTILDPACGSGNFLYLALQHVKDLELKAIRECEPLGLDRVRPEVSPRILRGIEINPFAAELARAVIWIGDLQWEIRHDLLRRTDPVLMDLDQIECRDALVALPPPCGEGGPAEPGREGVAPGSPDSLEQPPPDPARGAGPPSPQGGGRACEAPWPEAEFIVGNPPFLGGKKLRRDLGDETVGRLFAVYDGRVPREADLVAYWFEKARRQIAAGRANAPASSRRTRCAAGPTARCWRRPSPTRPCSRLGRRALDRRRRGGARLDGRFGQAMEAKGCGSTGRRWSGSTAIYRGERGPDTGAAAEGEWRRRFMGVTKGGAFDIAATREPGCRAVEPQRPAEQRRAAVMVKRPRCDKQRLTLDHRFCRDELRRKQRFTNTLRRSSLNTFDRTAHQQPKGHRDFGGVMSRRGPHS